MKSMCAYEKRKGSRGTKHGKHYTISWFIFQIQAKLQRILEPFIAQILSKNEKTKQTKSKTKAKPLCETRWVEKQTVFNELVLLYETVTFCLDKIEQNDDPDPKSLNDATRINKQLKSSTFRVAFYACHYIYGYTKRLSNNYNDQQLRLFDLTHKFL